MRQDHRHPPRDRGQADGVEKSRTAGWVNRTEEPNAAPCDSALSRTIRLGWLQIRRSARRDNRLSP